MILWFYVSGECSSVANNADKGIEQGSPNFFVIGPHKLLHNSSMARHLPQWDCFGIWCALPNQQFVCKYIIFSFLTHCLCRQMKWLCGPDGRALQAGFGPRAVVWRPLV